MNIFNVFSFKKNFYEDRYVYLFAFISICIFTINVMLANFSAQDEIYFFYGNFSEYDKIKIIGQEQRFFHSLLVQFTSFLAKHNLLIFNISFLIFFTIVFFILFIFFFLNFFEHMFNFKINFLIKYFLIVFLWSNKNFYLHYPLLSFCVMISLNILMLSFYLLYFARFIEKYNKNIVYFGHLCFIIVSVCCMSLNQSLLYLILTMLFVIYIFEINKIIKFKKFILVSSYYILLLVFIIIAYVIINYILSVDGFHPVGNWRRVNVDYNLLSIFKRIFYTIGDLNFYFIIIPVAISFLVVQYKRYIQNFYVYVLSFLLLVVHFAPYYLFKVGGTSAAYSIIIYQLAILFIVFYAVCKNKYLKYLVIVLFVVNAIFSINSYLRFMEKQSLCMVGIKNIFNNIKSDYMNKCEHSNCKVVFYVPTYSNNYHMYAPWALPHYLKHYSNLNLYLLITPERLNSIDGYIKKEVENILQTSNNISNYKTFFLKKDNIFLVITDGKQW